MTTFYYCLYKIEKKDYIIIEDKALLQTKRQGFPSLPFLIPKENEDKALQSIF